MMLLLYFLQAGREVAIQEAQQQAGTQAEAKQVRRGPLI